MITWAQIQPDFAWDGSWRDIYVNPATLADWEALFAVLRRVPGVEFRLDGALATLPNEARDIFAARASKSPMLCVDVEGVNVVFRFFCEEVIEADIDPRQVRGQLQLDGVLAFLKKIGDAVSKPVTLTPENLPEEAIVHYDPTSQRFSHPKKG
jgi:hypothetical protein